MKRNHLAVVFPANGLPRNPAQAHKELWTRTSCMLLPGLGKLYTQFHPAARPWGVDIPSPFSVVLGWEDPCLFLRLYLRARQYQREAIDFHAASILAETGFETLQRVGDTLICPVILDGCNERLKGHIFWHAAIEGGDIVPDCGVYYAEWERSIVKPGLEKSIESAPADYALSMVTTEVMT